MIDAELRKAWLPIAADDDLPFRHIYHGMLLGHELAVWRADDGNVNVWENRCLHRGVRLSIGVNEGSELRCQYHGWRYANRTANCTYIPAHPANAPARTACARTFPVAEGYGLIWSGIDPEREPPTIAALDATAPLVLRAMPVSAPADGVMDALLRHEFLPEGAILSGNGGRAIMETSRLDRTTMKATATLGRDQTTAVFIVQPVAGNRSVVRGLLAVENNRAAQILILRHHNERLAALRALIEETSSVAVATDEPEFELAASPTSLARSGGTGIARRAVLQVRVTDKQAAAEDIVAFRLEPLGVGLPDFEPGAHIDLHLPSGLMRQYSLTNGPGERAAYVIGVKREPQSTGGSHALHDHVRAGDVLTISEPHNNFRLVKGTEHVTLIAGGIGVTPLLAMAKSLHAADRRFTLHYFARSEAHIAFAPELARFGANVVRHLGLDGPRTTKTLETLLARPPANGHLYVCGPGPMLEATRAAAERLGWPAAAVHFEYFSNARALDNTSTFEVALARSALTLRVPPGKTIVEVLRENGVEVLTSCEQGACGTCLTSVLDGEPDHQDVYLSEAERATGACMLPCISRAKSPRLVLDL